MKQSIMYLNDRKKQSSTNKINKLGEKLNSYHGTKISSPPPVKSVKSTKDR